jgi:serine/threonine-protein kinase
MSPDAVDLTLVAPDSQAFDATVLGAATVVPAAPVSGVVTMTRTTVLPRVDSRAGAPALVVEPRARYAVDRILGEGGAGEVVRALDNDIARPVAIKRIRSEVKSAAMLMRFVEEIRTIGLLEHPNIVPIHDVGIDENGDYFFVMKYVEGETLEHVIERLAAGDPLYHARYPIEARVQLFRGILDAVAHAHARGYVHRDLKPANVMVGPHGQVVVMDWGIAKRIGTPDSPAMLDAGALVGDRLHRTAVGSLLGTPMYMAPEQARGEEATEKSDVYALSVLFYELLTLKHYLDDCTTLDQVLDGVKHRDAPIAGSVPSAFQRPVPMDLTWYLRAGMAKDPAKRYASVDAMIERLDLRAQGIVPIECHITFAKRVNGLVTRTLDRYPIQVTALMAIGALTSIGTAVALAARALG